MKELKSAPSNESVNGAHKKTHFEYSKDNAKRQLEELVELFKKVKCFDGITAVFYYGGDSISVHVNRELFTALYGNVFDEQIDMGELVTVKTNRLQVTCEKG